MYLAQETSLRGIPFLLKGFLSCSLQKVSGKFSLVDWIDVMYSFPPPSHACYAVPAVYTSTGVGTWYLLSTLVHV